MVLVRLLGKTPTVSTTFYGVSVNKSSFHLAAVIPIQCVWCNVSFIFTITKMISCISHAQCVNDSSKINILAIFYVNVLHKITNQINNSNVLLKWPIGKCIWRNSNLVAEGFRICLNKCISNEIPYSCVDLNSNDDNHISRVFKSSQLYRCHCFSSHHADYSSKKHLKDSSRKIIRNCFAIIIIIIANY